MRPTGFCYFILTIDDFELTLVISKIMLLKVDCLPNAVGKQPSIPLIYLGENGR